MLNVPEIGCVSISFRKASAELRGRFAFTEEKIRYMLLRLKENGLQGVILCTCNRTELYYCGSGFDTAVSLLSEQSGISADELPSYLDVYHNERAIGHLFRVAGGISSMVLGEDEILHQTKNAYKLAVSCGVVGYDLNRCFQSALACGKKIRSETFISQIPISTATIAANAAAGFGEKVNVLIIGASGNIGNSVLKNLLSHRNVSVSVTSRRHGNDIRFGDSVRIVDYNDRYTEIRRSDCVISATSSPHHTVTLRELTENGVNGRKLFIDLAVPADIDRRVEGAERFERIDIDGIGRLAKQNSLAREDSARAAKQIISREAERLKKELLYHWNTSLLNAAEKQIGADPHKTVLALKNGLDAAGFEAFLNIFTVS